MTTSEPRTPHDDTPRENRRLGQRILDAVLGDPADARHDDLADTRSGGPERAAGRTGVEGFAGDGPRGDYASYEQATRDRADGGVAQDDRAAAQGYAAPTPEPGGMPTDALHDAGQAGHVDRTDAVRDTGYDAGDTGYDAGDTVSDARRDAGQTAYVDRDDALRDAGYDARRDAGQAGYAGTAPDAAHDLPRPGTGTAVDDRDLVTSSYDPAQDTGYVDAGRAEADRTTGRRDDDLDTGRVDRDPGDRVLTEPVDRDRDDTHRGVGAAAGAGAGAAPLPPSRTTPIVSSIVIPVGAPRSTPSTTRRPWTAPATATARRKPQRPASAMATRVSPTRTGPAPGSGWSPPSEPTTTARAGTR